MRDAYQIIGNRFSFLPSWLVSSCVSRGWIFVTPDYRLIPETTAHSCLDDAVDAYNWVLTKMGAEIELDVGKVVIAGSSAGGYVSLVLATTYLTFRCVSKRYFHMVTNLTYLPPL